LATTTYKILGQIAPAANVSGGTTLYAPTGAAAVVSTLSICNRASTAATYRIAVRQGGAALADKQYLFYDATVPAFTTNTHTLGLTLAATDIITAVASTANLTFQAFGSEVA
jgi:hypothetical protein